VTSVLIDANLKFIDQQRDMGKIENASKLKVKEEDRTHKGKVKEARTYMGSTMNGKPHGRGLMRFAGGKVIMGDWYVYG